MKKKVLSLFSGIGAFEKALQNLGIEFDLVNYCEIDKYASKSYSLIHNVGEDLNLKDVTKVNTDLLPKDLDLVTYGFPCQDISQAGKQRGFEDAQTGERTRSGLFFDALRIIEDTKPKFAIAENVKALTSKKFETEFKIVLDSLEQAGYRNFWKVLNAKDYGIPQNRERVFVISVRNDVYLANNTFIFPNKEPLQLRLKDLLQQEVEEKYYIKKAVNMRITDNYIQYDNSGKGYNNQAERLYYQDGLCPTQPSSNNNGDKTQIILMDKENAIQYVNKDVCKTVRTGGHGSVDRHSWDLVAEPAIKIVEPFNTTADGSCKTLKANYAKTSIANLTEWGAHGATGARVTEPLICASRGRNPDNPSDRREGIPTEQRLEINKQGISNTLTTVQKDNYVLEPTDRILQVGNIVNTGNFDNPQRGRIYSQEGISPALNTVGGGGLEPKITDLMNYRIRKLTPTECWRLMGFTDEDINKCIAGGLSNAQLYKQAGNSIVVQVLEKILKALFDQTENEDLQKFINEFLY